MWLLRATTKSIQDNIDWTSHMPLMRQTWPRVVSSIVQGGPFSRRVPGEDVHDSLVPFACRGLQRSPLRAAEPARRSLADIARHVTGCHSTQEMRVQNVLKGYFEQFLPGPTARLAAVRALAQQRLHHIHLVGAQVEPESKSRKRFIVL